MRIATIWSGTISVPRGCIEGFQDDVQLCLILWKRYCIHLFHEIDS